MLWLALHLPQLSLEAFAATRPPTAAGRPVALLAGTRLVAADALAAQRGVAPGMKRSTALALAPDLQFAPVDAARDAAALLAVAHAALAFTPMVALGDAATVLMEVQSSLRLFGGRARLLQRLREAIAPLGHRVRVAAAPTAQGAAWLARWRDDLAEGAQATGLSALQQLLDAAPLGLLDAAGEKAAALEALGLATIGELRQLPRAGLARRFGAGLLDELDRAFGVRPDPRVPLVPAPVFESRLELFARADSTAQVLHGAGVLLARLVAWAAARQSRIAAFTLRMAHEPRRDATAATELSIVLAEPALDLGHLQLLLRERLARVELAAPTLELQLRCRDLVHRAAPNAELFPTRQGQAEGLARLLERLRARLGDEQVQRLVPVAEHRPERASRSEPALAGGGTAAGLVRPATALPLQRPVWLLPEPVPLAEREALPLLDGRALQLLSGPERIETGWWDDAPAARDYFIAAGDDGALVWIFRSRLPLAAGGWFLQGRFG
jgi:protein ImuB